MWVLFNKDYGYNKRDDLVDIDDVEAMILVEEKICQNINQPHEVAKNIANKKANELKETKE